MNELHFKKINDKDFDSVFSNMTPLEREYAEGVVESISECAPDAETAFSSHGSVLYARIYDGERYIFPFPFLLSDDGGEPEMSDACRQLAGYAKREMIPLIISDIPREELYIITDLFSYVDAEVYSDDDDSFFVRIKTECDMLESVPCIDHDGIRLDEIQDGDTDAYAELCGDAELNRYWGYDVSADNPGADKRFYIDTARREFADGIAVTLAVRHGGEFAGEAVIYGFDFCGAAEIAVRILPEYQGRGIGASAVRALIELSRRIGLKTLFASVMNGNFASVKMTSGIMDIKESDAERTLFVKQL